MGLVKEPCLNLGQFVSFGACASEPGCPRTSRVRCPGWRMKTLFFSCWRELHPQAVTVSPLVYLLESLSAWLLFLFHLGLPVGGGDIASRGSSLDSQEEEGVVGTTVEGWLCIVSGVVLLELGRGKGSSVWGGKGSSGFPISGFCFLSIWEIWA